MDGNQLRRHLKTIVQKHGIGHLRPIEADYMQGRITYTAYLQTLYQEYCKTLPFLNTRNPQPDPGAIYD